MSKSNIEWTDETWNPVVGCSKASPGCKHCYAERMAKRLKAMALADRAAGRDPGRKRHYIPAINDEGRWSGRLIQSPDAIYDPLGWKRPRMVFVNSMSDLFHPRVPFEYIDEVFAVMALAERHTFQVLTKHADRMLEYFRGRSSGPAAEAYAQSRVAGSAERIARTVLGENTASPWWDLFLERWPLKNVWLGTSVENQEWANRRLFDLLSCPAVIHFLSCEPLLGAVAPVMGMGTRDFLHRIGWVIAGGESGPGARWLHPDWVRFLRDACVSAGVPFFFKQWGMWVPVDQFDCPSDFKFRNRRIDIGGRDVTCEPSLWSPSDAEVYPAGKSRAGRMLDGRTWDEFPGQTQETGA